MAILKIKDDNGEIYEIPAIKGDKGDKGDPFTYEDFTEEQLNEIIKKINAHADEEIEDKFATVDNTVDARMNNFEAQIVTSVENTLEEFDERLEQKNDKTFIAERTFYEKTFTAIKNSSGKYIYSEAGVEFGAPYALSPSTKYTITFDAGTVNEYVMEYESSETISSTTNIGNMHILSENKEDTGEPFCVQILNHGANLRIWTADTNSHTIKIVETQTKEYETSIKELEETDTEIKATIKEHQEKIDTFETSIDNFATVDQLITCEEGFFTPKITVVDSSSSELLEYVLGGEYTRIGNMVYFTVWLPQTVDIFELPSPFASFKFVDLPFASSWRSIIPVVINETMCNLILDTGCTDGYLFKDAHNTLTFEDLGIGSTPYNLNITISGSYKINE